MKNDVDVVIPWLNPTEKWFSQYKNYCENEHPGRIRDLNTMRPTLRGILKNLPWIRYIWLVIYDEEQIINLDWVELKNEKIKFVYHRDIIPQEFLPNFNSMLTEAYIHNIKDLAEFVLFMNDDMIYTKSVSKDFYVKDGHSVHRRKTLHDRKESFGNLYQYIINSTCKFISQEFGKFVLAEDFHMPCILRKSLIENIWSVYGKKLHDCFVDSKIRRAKNISMVTLMLTIEEMFNMCEYKDDINVKTKPVWLNDNTTKKELQDIIKNNSIVCLNDGEILSNEGSIKIKEIIKDLF